MDDIRNDPLLRNVPEVDGFKVLPPCVISSLLGAGGFGSVYLARHVNLKIDVAVKCLNAHGAPVDPELIARFQREACLAATINDPNLVRVFDVRYEHGIHFIIMEYVEGETAGRRVQRKGKLPVPEALEIMLEAVSGVAAAHRQKIVHRDLKPANILISTTGEVKVADLGLAKLAEKSELTAAQTVMGTPAYMPPEQWEDTAGVGPPGDVYALGVTLFYLLAGETPYPSGMSEVELMKRIVLDPFPDMGPKLPGVPEAVVKVIERCTRKRPEERFPSAVELHEALERLAEDDPPTRVVGPRAAALEPAAAAARPAPTPVTLQKVSRMLQGDPGDAPTRTRPPAVPPGAPERPRSRRPAVLIAAGVVAALIAAAAFLVPGLLGPGGEKDPAKDGTPLSATAASPGSGEKETSEKPAATPPAKDGGAKGETPPKPKDDALAGDQRVPGPGPAAKTEMLAATKGKNGPALADGPASRGVDAERRPPEKEVIADSTPPEITIASPLPDTLTFAESIEVTGTVKDAGKIVSVEVGGKKAALGPEGKFSAIFPLAAPGRTRIDVKAVDEAGNPKDAAVEVERREPGEAPPWAKPPGGAKDYEYEPATRLPREVEDRETGIVLVLVPPGTYRRGAHGSDERYERESTPAHEVRITRPFYLGKYEVTHAQYGAYDSGHTAPSGPEFNRPECPVVEVKFQQAVDFCRSSRPGVERRYPFRLPTEAEWEHACRAGASSRYPWGEKVTDGHDYANCADGTPEAPAWKDGLAGIAPVGKKKPNALGLHDMIGNASEFCSGFLDPLEYAWYSRPVDDPRGPESGKFRVRRGGSYDDPPSRCTPSVRLQDAGLHGLSDTGFRVARDVDS